MKIAIIQKQGGAAENDEENYTVFRADALWRITRRNRVDFTYYAMNRDGTSELTVDIPDPGGGSFPAGTIVKTDFDMSAAAGLKSGQSDQKRNSEKENIECRIMNIECRSKVFCLFYKND